MAQYQEAVPQNHPWFTQFEKIITCLIQLSTMPTTNTMMIDVAFSAIVNLIKHTNNELVSKTYLERFIQLFQQTYQIKDKE